MNIAIGGDHAGFGLKNRVAELLRELRHRVEDVGAHEVDPGDDYPDFGAAVARELHEGRAERGVVICGSGVGVCVAVNKFPGLRAAICHDTYSARQGVEHDDMNVLCLGERIVGEALALEIVEAFAGARFSAEERHARRLEKVLAIERRFLRPPSPGESAPPEGERE